LHLLFFGSESTVSDSLLSKHPNKCWT